MEYVRLGYTGLKVSRICLGCMSFGVPNNIWPWVLDEDQSRTIIKRALELGINFFDTANVYSDGTSEEILGRALKDFAKRDEVVIATKVFFRIRTKPDGTKILEDGDLSRKSIMIEIDKSLKRLGTDYIDLYQIHRWDATTPIEETMETLHDLVKAGKVRYIGASSMYAWQFFKAQHVARIHNWTKFVSMQNYYNLLYREEEREMIPLCRDMGVGIIPYSPLAKGWLTRPWGGQTTRSETDTVAKRFYSVMPEADRKVIEAVTQVAEERGIPMAQVALSWLLNKEEITAPIIGVTKLNYLEDAVSALSIKLTDEEIRKLEEPYIPHPVMGLIPPNVQR